MRHKNKIQKLIYPTIALLPKVYHSVAKQNEEQAL